MAKPIYGVRGCSPNDTLPLIVGAVYQLHPDLGGGYVRIRAMDRKYVYVEGYADNIADFRVRRYAFDDYIWKIMEEWVPLPSTSFLRLSGEDGYLLLATGGRMFLHERGD